MNNTILKDDEAAIIFTENNISVAIPKQKDDEFVPDYVKICVGLAALWQKEDTQLILSKMIGEFFKEVADKIEENDEFEDNEGEGC